MIPLLDIRAQNLALEMELTKAFTRVLRSGQYILGPEVTALEAEIARMSGVEHAIGVSSGTDALLLALMALEIGPGDEVLCPAFTFFATAGCVARVGAMPVFVDVDAATFNVDLEDAARKVTKRTKAVIPVHLFGQCADMEPINQLARQNDLCVIEDAAQSLGASDNGHPAGSMGSFGAFSFYPTKNLGGLGDGGMLVCREKQLADKARCLRNHGAEQTYYHKYIGGNFRLDALQAAFLQTKVNGYSDYTLLRQRHARYYTENLSRLPHCTVASDDCAEGSAQVILPAVASGKGHIWNQYTLRIPGKREEFRSFLNQRGIQTAVYYPVPLQQQECFSHLSKRSECPVADLLSQQVVSLPIYPELTEAQLAEIVAAIADFCRI